MKRIFGLCAMLFVMSCASATVENNHDPYESFNRGVYAFNDVVDMILLKPVAQAYRFVVPEQGRTAMRNAFRNLYEPVTMANALFQGDDERFFTSFWRFVINTTLGFGGLYDFAGENTELAYREEDFGQTLAVWTGDSDSPYLVLPILGPSTTRDTLGRGVDIFLNPFNYYLETDDAIAVAVVGGIVQRERLLDPLDEINATSFDPYATIRSAYTQQRKAAIDNANSTTPNKSLLLGR